MRLSRRKMKATADLFMKKMIKRLRVMTGLQSFYHNFASFYTLNLSFRLRRLKGVSHGIKKEI